MKRNDGPGMSPDGKSFQTGGPFSGPSSITAAGFLTALQEEGAHLVESQGIQLSGEDNTQFKQAIALMINKAGGGDLASASAAMAAPLMGVTTAVAAPIVGSRGPRVWTSTGRFYAGVSSEEPTATNTIEPNDYVTGDHPGHLWPFVAPTAMMRGTDGGTYPACYKSYGLNHYKHGLRIPSETVNHASLWTIDVGGDAFGAGNNRMIEIIVEPELDLAAGFNATKGAGWQIGPIPGPVPPALGRWHARITAKATAYNGGFYTIRWNCNARFGTAEVPGAPNITLNEDRITNVHESVVDWANPNWLAVLIKTDDWGNTLGAHGAGNVGVQGDGSFIVRASDSVFRYDPTQSS